MIIETVTGVPITGSIISNYFRMLVNLFFKILPMREAEEPSLTTYMKSLQIELIGCNDLIVSINEDPLFLSLISILQFLIENEDYPVKDVKREVFKAISICNTLSGRYSGAEVAI